MPGPAFICVASKRSPGILKINRALTPLGRLQKHHGLPESRHTAAPALRDGAGRAVTITTPSFGHCQAELWPPPCQAALTLHWSHSGPSLRTSQGAWENLPLMAHLRQPVVRAMASWIGVLTSERTGCYAGYFIKSLKDTSLIVPEISTFHVAGAAHCSAPGNGTNPLPGSKQSDF